MNRVACIAGKPAPTGAALDLEATQFGWERRCGGPTCPRRGRNKHHKTAAPTESGTHLRPPHPNIIPPPAIMKCRARRFPVPPSMTTLLAINHLRSAYDAPPTAAPFHP
ncbi:hypothetical protein CR512_17440 [Pseudomonas putida]|nr:hypothetical protein CR512_17440 [Pseudomonas putida]